MLASQCCTMGTACQLLGLGTRLKTECFSESFEMYPFIAQFPRNTAQTSLRGGLGQEGNFRWGVSPVTGRQMSFPILIVRVVSLPVVLIWVVQRNRTIRMCISLSPERNPLHVLAHVIMGLRSPTPPNSKLETPERQWHSSKVGQSESQYCRFQVRCEAPRPRSTEDRR